LCCGTTAGRGRCGRRLGRKLHNLWLFSGITHQATQILPARGAGFCIVYLCRQFLKRWLKNLKILLNRRLSEAFGDRDGSGMEGARKLESGRGLRRLVLAQAPIAALLETGSVGRNGAFSGIATSHAPEYRLLGGVASHGAAT
jgi:hypothetical protein